MSSPSSSSSSSSSSFGAPMSPSPSPPSEYFDMQGHVLHPHHSMHPSLLYQQQAGVDFSQHQPHPLDSPQLLGPGVASIGLPSASGQPQQQQKRYRSAPAKTFQCAGYGDCRMVFSRSEHLARHIRKHTGERPFACHCSKQFSRLDNLRQHAQTVHSAPEDKPLNERMMRALAGVNASMMAGVRGRRRYGASSASAASCSTSLPSTPSYAEYLTSSGASEYLALAEYTMPEGYAMAAGQGGSLSPPPLTASTSSSSSASSASSSTPASSACSTPASACFPAGVQQQGYDYAAAGAGAAGYPQEFGHEMDYDVYAVQRQHALQAHHHAQQQQQQQQHLQHGQQQQMMMRQHHTLPFALGGGRHRGDLAHHHRGGTHSLPASPSYAAVSFPRYAHPAHPSPLQDGSGAVDYLSAVPVKQEEEEQGLGGDAGLEGFLNALEGRSSSGSPSLSPPSSPPYYAAAPEMSNAEYYAWVQQQQQ